MSYKSTEQAGFASSFFWDKVSTKQDIYLGTQNITTLLKSSWYLVAVAKEWKAQ